LIGCGHCRCLVEVWNSVHVDISSGTRIVKRGSATRGRSFAAREPVQLSIVGKIFARNRAKAPVVGQGHGRFTNCATME